MLQLTRSLVLLCVAAAWVAAPAAADAPVVDAAGDDGDADNETENDVASPRFLCRACGHGVFDGADHLHAVEPGSGRFIHAERNGELGTEGVVLAVDTAAVVKARGTTGNAQPVGQLGTGSGGSTPLHVALFSAGDGVQLTQPVRPHGALVDAITAEGAAMRAARKLAASSSAAGGDGSAGAAAARSATDLPVAEAPAGAAASAAGPLPWSLDGYLMQEAHCAKCGALLGWHFAQRDLMPREPPVSSVTQRIAAAARSAAGVDGAGEAAASGAVQSGTVSNGDANDAGAGGGAAAAAAGGGVVKLVAGPGPGQGGPKRHVIPYDASEEDARLAVLRGQCFEYHPGYWRYRWCHRDEVLQYHQGHTQIEREWSLGRFDGSGRIERTRSTSPSPGYYTSHFYVDGQRCDETGKGRATEVQFFCCSPHPRPIVIGATGAGGEAGGNGNGKQPPPQVGPGGQAATRPMGPETTAVLALVEEHALCKYRLKVCVPSLCQDADPAAAGAAPAASAQKAVPSGKPAGAPAPPSGGVMIAKGSRPPPPPQATVPPQPPAAAAATSAAASGDAPLVERVTGEVVEYREADEPALLEGLRGVCVDHGRGWWAYQWCHGVEVTQYHREPDGSVALRRSLGKYQSTASMERPRPGMLTPGYYTSHFYTDGQRCDETGAGRATEVQFFCCGHALQGLPILDLVEEPATCQYRVRVCVPALCKRQLVPAAAAAATPADATAVVGAPPEAAAARAAVAAAPVGMAGTAPAAVDLSMPATRAEPTPSVGPREPNGLPPDFFAVLWRTVVGDSSDIMQRLVSGADDFATGIFAVRFGPG